MPDTEHYFVFCRPRSSEGGSKQKCHKSKTLMFASVVLFPLYFEVIRVFLVSQLPTIALVVTLIKLT